MLDYRKILKFNANHDDKGRFASGPGGGGKEGDNALGERVNLVSAGSAKYGVPDGVIAQMVAGSRFDERGVEEHTEEFTKNVLEEAAGKSGKAAQDADAKATASNTREDHEAAARAYEQAAAAAKTAKDTVAYDAHMAAAKRHAEAAKKAPAKTGEFGRFFFANLKKMDFRSLLKNRPVA